MKTLTFALLGAAVCTLASSSSNFHQETVASLNKRLRPSRALHSPPSKRSPATHDAQASIVEQALTDPVNAAIAAQGLDNVKNFIDGGDSNDNTLISGDSESNEDLQANQYYWNSNVPFVANAVATSGGTADVGWTSLPALQGFDLVRNQVITENATQVSLMQDSPIEHLTNLSSAQPFYITSEYNAALIKKAVIVMPGKVSNRRCQTCNTPR